MDNIKIKLELDDSDFAKIDAIYNSITAQEREQIANFKKLNASIRGQAGEMEQLQAKEGALKKLRSETQDPKAIQGYTEALKNVGNQVEELSKKQKEHRKNVNETTSAWKFFSDSVKGAATLVATQFAFEKIKEYGNAVFETNIKTSDSLADIQKTAGLSAKEVQSLFESFKTIDTRTSLSGLMDIAKVGGSIGIAKNQLLDFTKSVDKVAIALGDEFTGGVEEVTKSLGTLQNLFADTKSLTAAESMTKVGSAINALGSAGSATGPVVADFANRIGQLGKLAPNIAQTLGLGAAFQELGLSSEIAAGGITNILLTAGKELPAYAKQLGLTQKETEKLINTNPNEFLIKLAKSFKGLASTDVAQRLEKLKIGSQESAKVMSLLAEKTDFVVEKQKLAADEFKKGTSIADEAKIKNENLAGSYAKLKKDIEGAFTNSAIQSGLKMLIDGIRSTFSTIGVFIAPAVETFKKAFAGFSEVAAPILKTIGTAFVKTFAVILSTIIKTAAVLISIPKFIYDNRTAFIALLGAVLVLNLALAKQTLQLILHKLELAISTAATTGLAAAQRILATATNTAATAMRTLMATMLANPIIAVVAALAGALVLMDSYADSVYEAEKRTRELAVAQKETARQIAVTKELAITTAALGKAEEQTKDLTLKNFAERKKAFELWASVVTKRYLQASKDGKLFHDKDYEQERDNFMKLSELRKKFTDLEKDQQEKSAAAHAEVNKERLKNDTDLSKRIRQAREEHLELTLNDEEKAAKAKLDFDHKEAQKELAALNASATKKAELQAILDATYIKKRADISRDFEKKRFEKSLSDLATQGNLVNSILEQQLAEQMLTQDDFDALKLRTELNFLNEQEALTREAYQKGIINAEDFNARLTEIQANQAKKRVQILDQEQRIIDNLREKDYANQLAQQETLETQLIEMRADGQISEQTLIKKTRAMQMKASQERIAELQKQQDIDMNNAKLTAEERQKRETETNAKILTERKKLAKTDLEITKEREELRKAIIAAAIEITQAIIAAGQETNNMIAEQDILQINNKYDAQVAALTKEMGVRQKAGQDTQSLEAKIAETNAKREEEIKIRKIKQARLDKALALTNIALQTGVAITAGIAAIPVPPFPAAIAAGVVGALQLALAAARPIPQFATGVIDLQGQGTSTSDSILARLSKGESVMTARETHAFRPTLEAIRAKKISPMDLNALALGKMSPRVLQALQTQSAQPNIHINNLPQKESKVHINIDENGISTYVESENMRRNILNRQWQTT